MVFERGKAHVRGTVFNSLSKVFRDSIGLNLLRSVIGPENLRHFFNQSDEKLKPIMTWSPTFSRDLVAAFFRAFASQLFFPALSPVYCSCFVDFDLSFANGNDNLCSMVVVNTLFFSFIDSELKTSLLEHCSVQCRHQFSIGLV